MKTEVEPLDSIAAITVKLRRERFIKACDERGLKTDAAIATLVGLSEKTVRRVVNLNDNPKIVPDDPSGQFIGRTLAAWPMYSFRALFAVVDETTGEEVR